MLTATAEAEICSKYLLLPSCTFFFWSYARLDLVGGFGSGPFCTSKRGNEKNTVNLALFVKVLATWLALLSRHTQSVQLLHSNFADTKNDKSYIACTTPHSAHQKQTRSAPSNHQTTSPVMSFFSPLQVRKSSQWDNTTWYSFKGLFRKAGQRRRGWQQ